MHAGNTRLLAATVAALSALLAAHPSMANPPYTDAGFGNNGLVRIAFNVGGNHEDHAHDVAIVDGGLRLLGLVRISDNTSDLAFAGRLTSTGDIDPLFGNINGTALTGLAPMYGEAVIAATGKGELMFAGNGNPSLVIGRRNADGSTDTSFNLGGHRFLAPGFFLSDATFSAVSDLVVLADGRAVITGYAARNISGPMPEVCAFIARVHADGALDTSLGGGHGSVCIAPDNGKQMLAYGHALRVLDDGRILVAGGAEHGGASGLDMSLARLLPDGTPDVTFGTDGSGWAFVAFDQHTGLVDLATALDITDDGTLVLAGIVDVSGGDRAVGLARLLPDGSPDPGFGPDGRVLLTGAPGSQLFTKDVHVLPDERLLVGVDATGTAAAIMLQPDGSIDPDFGNNGWFRQWQSGQPEAQRIRLHRLLLDTEHLYMVGTGDSAGGSADFAISRHLLPLFRNGFETGATPP